MGRNNNGKKTEQIGSMASDLHSCFGRVQIYGGTHSILKLYSPEDVGEVPEVSVISGLNVGEVPVMSVITGLNVGDVPAMSVITGLNGGEVPVMSVISGLKGGEVPVMSVISDLNGVQKRSTLFGDVRQPRFVVINVP